MSPVKAYGKVDEADQERLEARRKTIKRIAIRTLSFIVFVGVIVAAVALTVGTSNDDSNKNSNPGGSVSGAQSLSTSIKTACKITLYPDSCYNSLSLNVNGTQVEPEKLLKISIQVAKTELLRLSEQFSPLGLDGIIDNMSVAALKDCRDLLDLAVDHLDISMSSGELNLFESIDDLRTWLSAAGTYQQTCIDSFEGATQELKGRVVEYMKNSTEFTSNSLAIVTAISQFVGSIKLRRLMSYSLGELPEWLASKDRKLLQSSKLGIKADVVVARDGTGDYKTIGAALNVVPEKSKNRFVIYVKNGVYKENVIVEKKKWNVMMVGDGKDATIVSGSLNYADGTPTFSTATFAVRGKGFIARDIGFFNTAGPNKHQAVALMSTSDQSVFYRCRFDAFQDTLYPHSLRQFYRECDIYGTVDFIFGNAAVVFQNCNILPRVPMAGQQNTITAQGRIDPNQNTGISIHNCTVLPWGDLSSVRTYLGRPWKNHSTTVYMHSTLGSLIDPAGWLPWTGNSAPDTIFYSEYQNFGPGSSTKNRVKWKGLRTITSKEAIKFTVKSFIKGDKWIPDAGVNYKSGL